MARRKRHEDHVNHESWAIPYGDLVTLLLAFFVVMYAVSSVNEGKYRVLADSLVAAFRGAPRAMEPIQTGAFQVRADEEIPTGLPRTLVPFEVDRSRGTHVEGEDTSRRSGADTGQGRGLGEGRGAGLGEGWGPGSGSGATRDADSPGNMEWVLIERLADEVVAAMAPLIEADMISVRRVSYWLEVEINTNFLFASGSATVASEAVPVIRELAGILNNASVRLQVEGHTDSVPISTAQFPSNWELSAGRAASVVHLLEAYGVNPAAMAAVGYGEHRPVGDNDTVDGRRKNRRVLIVVLSGEDGSRELADPAAASEAVTAPPEAAAT